MQADFEADEVTDPGDAPHPSLHAEAHIQCTFSFRCPLRWSSLQRTPDPDKRYCAECEKEVHLVRSQDAYTEHARQKHCVAVIQPGQDDVEDLMGDIELPSD